MKRDMRGFSLIEIIAVMVILGILASLGGIGLSRSVSMFNFTRENDAMAQKAQIALNRILIEFTYFDTTAAAGFSFSENTYQYPVNIGGTKETNTFRYDPDARQLLWNGVVLCDNVSAFSMTPEPATLPDMKSISVVLSLTGQNSVTQTFNSYVAIKNLGS